MNILVCSAGRRVKLVSYFKEELNRLGGKVIAADCNPTAPALQFADYSEVVPRITQQDYLLQMKQLCKKHKIDAVLSLIDPELSLWAQHKEEFEQDGITILTSDKQAVISCFDKYQTYQLLKEHQLPRIPTYIKLEEVLEDLQYKKLVFPLIIKPRMGSASLGVTKIHNLGELHAFWKENGDYIVQPFLEGTEYGVDCYIDLKTKQAAQIFGKEKLTMRAGETDKSLAVHDPGLFDLIEKVVKVFGLVGPVDVDCFKTEKGYVVSEINPRFGGGYPHAHEAGQNFIKCIIQNLAGLSNQPQIGNYQAGSVMIKYDHVRLLQPSQEKRIH